jgi:hypothetical protein
MVTPLVTLKIKMIINVSHVCSPNSGEEICCKLSEFIQSLRISNNFNIALNNDVVTLTIDMGGYNTKTGTKILNGLMSGL